MRSMFESIQMFFASLGGRAFAMRDGGLCIYVSTMLHILLCIFHLLVAPFFTPFPRLVRPKRSCLQVI
jgi:hypothetical protein